MKKKYVFVCMNYVFDFTDNSRSHCGRDIDHKSRQLLHQ